MPEAGTKVTPSHNEKPKLGVVAKGACKIGTMLVTLKSASVLVSEVCRAWMENDANEMVVDAGMDFPICDGGSQAKCPLILLVGVELGGAGGNIIEEGTQGDIADAAPEGVALP
jgi:hypothetical protein